MDIPRAQPTDDRRARRGTDTLVKIGARIVRHGRYLVFQLAEVAVPRVLFAKILRRIDGLRLLSPPFPARGAGAMNDCHPTDEVRAFMIRGQQIATLGRPATAARASGGWW